MGCELLRDVGLEEIIGETFGATVRLAFDAHSADSHFLALPEFKQLYYHLAIRFPNIFPRMTPLKITIISAKGLPPADANGKADPYCTCQVISQDTGKAQLVSMSQTKIHQKTLDPWWGFET